MIIRHIIEQTGTSRGSVSALSALLLCVSLGAGAQEFISPEPHSRELKPREDELQIDDRSSESEQSTQPSFITRGITRGLKAMESSRDYLSTGYVGMAANLDHYFTEQTFDEGPNESYIKLELRDTMFEQGDHEYDVRIKAKVDLPNTERRLKLIFSSDERQDESLESRTRAISTGERVGRQSSVTGIEYTPSAEWHRWKRSARLGIRVRVPLVPFARYRLLREWEMGEHWDGRFRESFWYFDDRGWGATSEISFSRPINEQLSFKLWGEAEYKDSEDGYEFVQGYSLFHFLSERALAEYRMGFIGSSQPNPRTNSFFWGLHYRRSLYEDWVFLNFIPEIYYPREEGWSAEPSVTFKLEVYFSD